MKRELDPTKFETNMLRKIVRRMQREYGRLYGGGFPNRYITLDIETSGFKKEEDLLCEFGFCTVDNREAEYFETYLLNWADHDMIDEDWLRKKLQNVRYHMGKQGRTFHIDIPLMRKKGMPPEEGLEILGEKLQAIRKDLGIFIGHNIIGFDAERIQIALKEWIGLEFEFHESEMLDTALIEKASQVGMVPFDDESVSAYWHRVRYASWPGVKFNLDDHVVKKYNLVELYDLDMSNAHQAGFDAMLAHLFIEELREIAKV
jgi:hypothetical protein